VTVDQWQLEKLALVATRHPVSWFVPGLPEDCQRKIWHETHATPAEAVAAFTANLPRNATIAVIPEGPYVLARA
jgi:hypothetical protein